MRIYTRNNAFGEFDLLKVFLFTGESKTLCVDVRDKANKNTQNESIDNHELNFENLSSEFKVKLDSFKVNFLSQLKDFKIQEETLNISLIKN